MKATVTFKESLILQLQDAPLPIKRENPTYRRIFDKFQREEAAETRAVHEPDMYVIAMRAERRADSALFVG